MARLMVEFLDGTEQNFLWEGYSCEDGDGIHDTNDPDLRRDLAIMLRTGVLVVMSLDNQQHHILVPATNIRKITLMDNMRDQG